MKKFFIFIIFLLILILPNNVFAYEITPDPKSNTCTTPECVFGTITAPTSIQPLVSKGGSGGISDVLTKFIILFYQIALILFLFMVVFSALQWITSGGDKEKVASARGRLTSAIIGLVILGLAWVITSTLGYFTGISMPFK